MFTLCCVEIFINSFPVLRCMEYLCPLEIYQNVFRYRSSIKLTKNIKTVQNFISLRFGVIGSQKQSDVRDITFLKQPPFWNIERDSAHSRTRLIFCTQKRVYAIIWYLSNRSVAPTVRHLQKKLFANSN